MKTRHYNSVSGSRRRGAFQRRIVGKRWRPSLGGSNAQKSQKFRKFYKFKKKPYYDDYYQPSSWISRRRRPAPLLQVKQFRFEQGRLTDQNVRLFFKLLVSRGLYFPAFRAFKDFGFLVKQRLHKEPFSVLRLAIRGLAPSVQLRNFKKSGKILSLPLLFSSRRRPLTFAARWFVRSALDGSRLDRGPGFKGRMSELLFLELSDFLNARGVSYSKRLFWHRTAFKNRSLSHYGRKFVKFWLLRKNIFFDMRFLTKFLERQGVQDAFAFYFWRTKVALDLKRIRRRLRDRLRVLRRHYFIRRLFLSNRLNRALLDCGTSFQTISFRLVLLKQFLSFCAKHANHGSRFFGKVLLFSVVRWMIWIRNLVKKGYVYGSRDRLRRSLEQRRARSRFRQSSGYRGSKALRCQRMIWLKVVPYMSFYTGRLDPGNLAIRELNVLDWMRQADYVYLAKSARFNFSDNASKYSLLRTLHLKLDRLESLDNDLVQIALHCSESQNPDGHSLKDAVEPAWDRNRRLRSLVNSGEFLRSSLICNFWESQGESLRAVPHGISWQDDIMGGSYWIKRLDLQPLASSLSRFLKARKLISFYYLSSSRGRSFGLRWFLFRAFKSFESIPDWRLRRKLGYLMRGLCVKSRYFRARARMLHYCQRVELARRSISSSFRIGFLSPTRQQRRYYYWYRGLQRILRISRLDISQPRGRFSDLRPSFFWGLGLYRTYCWYSNPSRAKDPVYQDVRVWDESFGVGFRKFFFGNKRGLKLFRRYLARVRAAISGSRFYRRLFQKARLIRVILFYLFLKKIFFSYKKALLVRAGKKGRTAETTRDFFAFAGRNTDRQVLGEFIRRFSLFSKGLRLVKRKLGFRRFKGRRRVLGALPKSRRSRLSKTVKKHRITKSKAL